MVQELHVLKCFSCETFQSHIVKKTKKWECKICGTKQSIKKVYGMGSGRDCRLHTQKLNALRGKKLNLEFVEENKTLSSFEPHSTISKIKPDLPKNSKWSVYLYEDSENITVEESPSSINDLNTITSNFNTLKRKRGYKTADNDRCLADEHDRNNESYSPSSRSSYLSNSNLNEKEHCLKNKSKRTFKYSNKIVQSPIDQIGDSSENSFSSLHNIFSPNKNTFQCRAQTEFKTPKPDDMRDCTMYQENNKGLANYLPNGSKNKCGPHSEYKADNEIISPSFEFRRTVKDLTRKSESNAQLLLTLPVFEQVRDFNECDFNLDF